METKTMARLLSVNVGLPRDVEWQGRTVHTGIWKAPVQGRRMVRRARRSGGARRRAPGRAVFVY
jgi:MOSC domain-containing protein YiiM